MRKRKLAYEDVVGESIVYAIRIRQFRDLVAAWTPYKDADQEDEQRRDIAGTLKMATFVWFTSLMDTQGSAVNVFDVWVTLFPALENEIISVWQRIEPGVRDIKRIRDKTGAHGTKSLTEYIRVRRTPLDTTKAMTVTIEEFLGLARKMRNKFCEFLKDSDQSSEYRRCLRQIVDKIGSELKIDWGQTQGLFEYLLRISHDF